MDQECAAHNTHRFTLHMVQVVQRDQKTHIPFPPIQGDVSKQTLLKKNRNFEAM